MSGYIHEEKTTIGNLSQVTKIHFWDNCIAIFQKASAGGCVSSEQQIIWDKDEAIRYANMIIDFCNGMDDVT